MHYNYKKYRSTGHSQQSYIQRTGFLQIKIPHQRQSIRQNAAVTNQQVGNTTYYQRMRDANLSAEIWSWGSICWNSMVQPKYKETLHVPV